MHSDKYGLDRDTARKQRMLQHQDSGLLESASAIDLLSIKFNELFSLCLIVVVHWQLLFYHSSYGIAASLKNFACSVTGSLGSVLMVLCHWLKIAGLAGVLGRSGRGVAKKRRPLLGRGVLQNFSGTEIQNRYCSFRSRTSILKRFRMSTTPLYV